MILGDNSSFSQAGGYVVCYGYVCMASTWVVIFTVEYVPSIICVRSKLQNLLLHVHPHLYHPPSNSAIPTLGAPTTLLLFNSSYFPLISTS
jgi:hypothetical protein